MNTTTRTKLATLAAFAFVATASAFYNPEVGRWLNRDPIGEQGGQNIYVFALNDGPNRIDPLGQRSAVGAGKLCVSKNCQRQYLPSIQYIPEDPPYVLHRLPEPGQCVDIDAVYFPGEAWKVSDNASVTVECSCTGAFRKLNYSRWPWWLGSGSIWKAGDPKPADWPGDVPPYP